MVYRQRAPITSNYYTKPPMKHGILFLIYTSICFFLLNLVSCHIANAGASGYSANQSLNEGHYEKNDPLFQHEVGSYNTTSITAMAITAGSVRHQEDDTLRGEAEAKKDTSFSQKPETDQSASTADTAEVSQFREPPRNIHNPTLQDLQIKVYPNPGSGIFHVEINNTRPRQLKFGIYDLTGKEIWQRTLMASIGCKTSINLHPYNDGIYLLKIQSGNQQRVIKLLKQ